jgi:hypothetical protein
MKHKQLARFAAAALATALTIAALGTSAARADAVSIIVNGTPVSFDQPPIERSGRVFVPLRGVFERLGASVVYDNGTINATGDGHNIQLRIGSTAALVDGTTRQLDVAPFLVGARTLVPLRFISEALGANVAYDDTSRTVTIGMGGTGYVAPQPPPATSVALHNLQPQNGSVTASARPAISGKFGVPVDPNSVRMLLDGRDVSGGAYVSSTDFLFTPSYDLTPQRHTVEISGRAQNGTPFDRSWSFSAGIASNTNFLQNLTPANGAAVGQTFTVSGVTLPNARVRIAATGANVIAGILRAQTGTYTTDVQADSSGRFSVPINLSDVGGGGQVAVQITSVDPNTNAGASATLTVHSG